MNREDWLWTIGVGVFVIAVLLFMGAAKSECSDKGGVLMRGAVGYECVRMEVIK